MMRAGDYGVEVLTAYEFRRVGQVFYPPGILREALIRRGLVRARTAEDVRKAAPPVTATTGSFAAVQKRRKAGE